MLHYTLTGEKIPTSEFFHMADSSEDTHNRPVEKSDKTRKHGTWAAEQAMMKLVEDGNLDYRKLRDRFIKTVRVGKMSVGEPICQVKNQIIILTAMCTRAAIRVDLAPTIAYTISDRYIQSIESCTTIAGLAEVSHAMKDDFVRRVHQLKHQSGICTQIQKCCDYIQLHVEDKITVSHLADLVGYADNYLVKKSHQETGKTIRQYVLEAKLERAKQLLGDSNGSIQDISEQLGFASQSHFGEKFKKYTGVTPTQWRDHVLAYKPVLKKPICFSNEQKDTVLSNSVFGFKRTNSQSKLAVAFSVFCPDGDTGHAPWSYHHIGLQTWGSPGTWHSFA